MKLGNRSRAIGLTISVSVALGLGAQTPPATANQLTVFSCHDPAGHGIGDDGWTFNRTADDAMSITDSCASGGEGALSLELAANMNGYGEAARAEWLFHAPTWASIASYEVAVSGSYALPGTGGGIGQALIYASDESDPNYDYRNLGAAAQGAYILRRTPPSNPTFIDLNASCDGQTGRCASNAPVSRLAVSSTAIVLNDPSTPIVSGLTGPLVSGAPISGSVDASFNAADSGPGVYSAQLVIDSVPSQPVILDRNNGWCVDQGQTTDGTRSFDHPDPCPAYTSGTITLDSRTLSDGQHNLKLLVDDASGNTTTAFNATITVDNTPGTKTTALASGIAGTNGAPEAARLTLATHGTIRRSYANSALRLPGELTDAEGKPIVGAALDAVVARSGSSEKQTVAHAVSDANGKFSMRVPAGPSRGITLEYEPHGQQAGAAAEVTVNESVSARVTLNVSPKRAAPSGAITLSGTVAGPIPARGVVVELLVHYRGHWEPFRTPRSDAHGHFRVTYQFQGSIGRFPFRARVLGEQVGFPYSGGQSRAVDVATS